MLNLEKTIPPYITEKSNIIKLIIFTAAFALVFINIYAPFGVTYWYANVTKLELFFYSSLIILTGVLVVVISRFIMFIYSKKHTINYLTFSIWILAEVFFMAMFYVIYEKLVLHEKPYFFELFKISVLNTALVLLLPYSALWLYFSLTDKKKQLELITQGQVLPDYSNNMAAFHDEKGVLRLSLKIENLIFLEAADNYVNIYYINKDRVSKFLLRNSLKQIECMFAGTNVIRCHRSYIVNFQKVKVLRKDKDGLMLEFEHHQVADLPVSKTYVENVMNTFMNYSKATGIV